MATPDHWGLADRRLYLCTPDRPDLELFVDACLAGGVDLVQLREKHLDDARLAERASLVHRVCREHGVPFILNDRPDLAAAIGADGVHVGQEDVSPVDARHLVGDGAIIGLSTHAASDLQRALGGPGTDGGSVGRRRRRRSLRSRGPQSAPAPVQYLSAGPVAPTPTKPGRPGTGLGYVSEAVARSPWPVWITGGVDPTTVGPMAAAGGRHFVVVRWLTEADDPQVSSHRLREAIEEAIEEAGPQETGLTGDRPGSRPLSAALTGRVQPGSPTAGAAVPAAGSAAQRLVTTLEPAGSWTGGDVPTSEMTRLTDAEATLRLNSET